MILSLTRTSRVGYLRDVRRLTVALSRARLGLYILGRREVFESCFELKPAFDVILRRPDKLSLVSGETYPTQRTVNLETDATEMEGVEHLGQYVFEMTQAKVAALKAESKDSRQLETTIQGSVTDVDMVQLDGADGSSPDEPVM